MNFLIWLIGYIVSFIVFVRLGMRKIEMDDGFADTEDAILMGVFALPLCLLWFLFVPVLALWFIAVRPFLFRRDDVERAKTK